MKKKVKRISRRIAWLLAGALVFMLFPATALAADTYQAYTPDEFVAAINSAKSGDTIKLMASFECGYRMKIDGKALTFNLNGYTLTVSDNGNAAAYAVVLDVTNGGELNLTGGGKLNVIVWGRSCRGVRASGGSRATISNVTYEGFTDGYIEGRLAEACDPDSYVEVTGKLWAKGANHIGAYADNGGHVKVYGDIDTAFQTVAKGEGSLVEVMGNCATGWNDGYGAHAFNNGVIHIYGNVNDSWPLNYGAHANGGGTVIIDGLMRAPYAYVILPDGTRDKASGLPGSGTYADYIVYSYTGETPTATSNVYVKNKGAIFDPAKGSFDKKTENQADVLTTALWGYGTSVTNITKDGESIGSDNYRMDGSILTIKKEYLAGQSVGSLELLAVFDSGSPEPYTIAIHDTTQRTVTFDPQGGTVDPSTKTVVAEEAYGTLPTPVKAGQFFGGWYTGVNGAGDKIGSATIVTISADQTLYAKWTPVLTMSSSVPGGKIYTGGRITFTPNVAGGSWEFDDTLLLRDGSKFTGRKAGKTRVTYLVDGGEQSVSFDVTILKSQLAATGQSFAGTWALAAAGITLAGAAVLLAFRNTRKKRVKS